MTKRSEILELMEEGLPAISHQKKLCYRTNYDEVVYLYRLINREVFYNELKMPVIEVMPRCRQYWGICYGEHQKPWYGRSLCKIRVMDKWYCHQWLINTLAHEMAHQYQWDIIGDYREDEGKQRLMSHGPTFFMFKEQMREHGLALKVAHSRRKWFKHQNLFKC